MIAARQRATATAGALRRRRVLLLSGCGDVGLRLLRLLARAIADGRTVPIAATRNRDQLDEARKLGARPLPVDLDDPGSVRRLRPFLRRVIHLAPPPAAGETDPRLARLLSARLRPSRLLPPRSLPTRSLRNTTMRLPDRWVLISTTGVYGDCAGALVTEARPIAPRTARARRRADAERRLRGAVAAGGLRASILRVPGIYAADRLPLARIRAGTSVPLAPHDPFTNHIHADDLARIAWIALWRGRSGRVVNAVDQSRLTAGQWFDRVADAYGQPRPPRQPIEQIARTTTEMAMSFLRESRRIDNQRLRRELRVRLHFPTVDAFLEPRRKPL